MIYWVYYRYVSVNVEAGTFAQGKNVIEVLNCKNKSHAEKKFRKWAAEQTDFSGFVIHDIIDPKTEKVKP